MTNEEFEARFRYLVTNVGRSRHPGQPPRFEEQGVNFGIAVGPDVVQRPIPFDPIPCPPWRGATARTPGQVCVAGIDLVKVGGTWTVLEDNLRVPSGVAYALAARRAMLELHRDETVEYGPRSVSEYARSWWRA